MTRSEAGKIGASVSTPRLQAQARKRYYENPNYCKQCGKIIHPEEGVSRACARARDKKFCNRSCAAQYTNLGRQRKPWSEEAKQRHKERIKARFPNPKKPKTHNYMTVEPSGTCEKCGVTVLYREVKRKDQPRYATYYSRRRYCETCLPKIKAKRLCPHLKVGNGVDFLEDLTKAELREHYNYKSFRSYFPMAARKVYLSSGQPLVCKICGYSKAVDICHKRPVSDFPDDTPVRDINHIDNLTCLCKNCHWELDHDLLDEGVVL